MDIFNVNISFLLNFSLLVIGSSEQAIGGSPFVCSSENNECQHRDGPLDVLVNVQTIEECRQLCLDRYCYFTTYYHSDGFPANNLCMLFEGCDSLISCSNCTSHDMNCFTMGSIAQMAGTIGENALEAIEDVHSAAACKEKCSSNSKCLWFTYFFENDILFPNICFLQTEIVAPLRMCDHCLSGPLYEDCFIMSMSNGEKNQSLMLTDTSQDHKFVAFGSESCQLRALVVGAGGGSNGWTTGGSGSGYIKNIQVSMPSFNEEIQVSIGGSVEESAIKINNHETFRAEPGRSTPNLNGGDGYSGGGSYDSAGGSDGSDGEGNYGGHGTGEDITNYKFFAFEITPGQGGNADGGGGGGVLVNGQGPDGGSKGQGYGGGGGHSGVVLIEVFN